MYNFRIGWGKILTFTSFSDESYVKKRRLIHQSFTRHKVADYRPIQEEETIVLLHNLLENPDDFDDHFHL